MLKGLALLNETPSSRVNQQEKVTASFPIAENDPALVRLLANMVLHIQSEVQHVY